MAYSQQPTPEITSAGGDADAGRGRGDAPGSKLRGPDDQGELPGPGARHPHSRAAAVLYRRARRASSGCRRDVDAITGSERVRAGGRGVFAPDTASQGMVTGKEIDEQPRSRFAEVLEVVSGLIGHPVPIRAPVTTNPSARRGRWHPRLLASGSQLTLRWREMDSNFRFRASGDTPHRPRGEAASHRSRLPLRRDPPHSIGYMQRRSCHFLRRPTHSFSRSPVYGELSCRAIRSVACEG